MAETANTSNHIGEGTSDIISLEDKKRAIEVMKKNDEVINKAMEQLAYTAEPQAPFKTFFAGVLFGMTLGYFGNQPSRNLLK